MVIFYKLWKMENDRSAKMSKKVKNVKNSDFLVNMKYAVFCCF